MSKEDERRKKLDGTSKKGKAKRENPLFSREDWSENGLLHHFHYACNSSAAFSSLRSKFAPSQLIHLVVLTPPYCCHHHSFVKYLMHKKWICWCSCVLLLYHIVYFNEKKIALHRFSLALKLRFVLDSFFLLVALFDLIQWHICSCCSLPFFSFIYYLNHISSVVLHQSFPCFFSCCRKLEYNTDTFSRWSTNSSREWLKWKITGNNAIMQKARHFVRRKWLQQQPATRREKKS